MCIHQKDNNERSQQVSIMGMIFKQASQVSIWLGPGDDTTNIAVRVIRDIAYHLYSEVNTSMSIHSWLSMVRVQKNLDSMFKDQWSITDSKLSVVEREALSRLLQAEWFFRVWVIQEASKNSNVSVFCGAHTIPWNMLGLTSAWLYHTLPGSMYDGRLQWSTHWAAKNACFIWNYMPEAVYAQDFLHVLKSTQQFRATDARDKVFAMLTHGIDNTCLDSAPGSSGSSTSADHQVESSPDEQGKATISGSSPVSRSFPTESPDS